MEDLKLRAYTPDKNKLNLSWEFDVFEEWGTRDDNWFIHALRAPMDELDTDQEYIRVEFNDATDRSGLTQGGMLCIGERQCYMM